MQGLKHESLSHESKLTESKIEDSKLEKLKIKANNRFLINIDIAVGKESFTSRLKKDALFILVLLLGGLVPIINLF